MPLQQLWLVNGQTRGCRFSRHASKTDCCPRRCTVHSTSSLDAANIIIPRLAPSLSISPLTISWLCYPWSLCASARGLNVNTLLGPLAGSVVPVWGLPVPSTAHHRLPGCQVCSLLFSMLSPVSIRLLGYAGSCTGWYLQSGPSGEPLPHSLPSRSYAGPRPLFHLVVRAQGLFRLVRG